MAEVLEPIQIHTQPALEMDNDRFFEFCQQNSDLRFERNAEGDIIIMTPEGGSSGHGSIRLGRYFDLWAEENGTGQAFGSSTGFILPNGAVRAPDVSWVSNARLSKIKAEEWKKFLPLCPDFVLELRSPSDRLNLLQNKMVEYIKNGSRLGWLIDPETKRVYIYRPKARPKMLLNPRELIGDPVLPGFKLDLQSLWSAMRIS
jgi:Uma2 family endonuclease